MKDIILYFFLCFISFSCSSDITNDPYFDLSEKTLLFPSKGGKQNVLIESNVKWDISSISQEWLSWEKKLDNEIVFHAQENYNTKIRECFVGFEYEGGTSRLLIQQSPKEELYFEGDDMYTFTSRKDTLRLKVKTNVTYDFILLDNGEKWISHIKKNVIDFGVGNNEHINFQIEENYTTTERNARIVIFNEKYLLTDTITISQEGKISETYEDGNYFIAQKSPKGCVSLIVIGDGFINKDMGEGGYYEINMNKAMEHFFSIEPFKSYREYFDVYMVVAKSEEEGVGEKGFFGGNTIDNKFGTAFGDGTEILCNDELIFEYARKVKELPEDKPITVLVVLNSDKYAGTAYLYPDGNSIALCPMSTAEPPNDFEGIVHHEAGGHAFGFLLDEYVYNQREMPDERKKEIQEWQKMGYQMNLDFTDDLDNILWKDFIGIDKYAPVGAYEGGYEYQYGVWRSEENSCMNNNVPYYNVQSRWSIVNRIMQLSDIEFTIQDFIENDYPVYPTGSRALNTWGKFAPLGRPVWAKK